MARPAQITPVDLRRAARMARHAVLSGRWPTEGVLDAGAFNVRTRFSSGTHIARGAGIVASCTEGSARALVCWADKAEARADVMETGA